MKKNKEIFFAFVVLFFILILSFLVYAVGSNIKSANYNLIASIKGEPKELICGGVSYNSLTHKCCKTCSKLNSDTESISSINKDLDVGSSGSDVAELQAFLVSKGFLVMPVGVTRGYFGALTQAALARYQAANGIAPADGYFDSVTKKAINIEIANDNGCTDIFKVLKIDSFCESEFSTKAKTNQKWAYHGEDPPCVPNCSNKNCGDGDGCGGKCSGPCPNIGECKTNTCGSDKTCHAANKPDGISCSNDGNVCTPDFCHAGLCTHPGTLKECKEGSEAAICCPQEAECSTSGEEYDAPWPWNGINVCKFNSCPDPKYPVDCTMHGSGACCAADQVCGHNGKFPVCTYEECPKDYINCGETDDGKPVCCPPTDTCGWNIKRGDYCITTNCDPESVCEGEGDSEGKVNVCYDPATEVCWHAPNGYPWVAPK
jgi:hypothetical protein